MTLSELATQIGAQLQGNSSDPPVVGIATLTRAGPQEVSFFTKTLYREELAHTGAAAVIIAPKDQHLSKVPVLLLENPYLGYARAAALFDHSSVLPPPGIHPTAWVSPHATIDATVSVGAQAVIEAGAIIDRHVIIGPGCVIETGVRIGEETHLRAHVTLCKGTQLGMRVLIHPGAVIGSDGFGLANDKGNWVKIPQLGGVDVEDEVEIGANTTIDKGSLGNTVIHRGVKLDNQIQIGHNVEIGEHTAIAGCVGIAGSSRIGRYCMIGGGVGIVGHIEIADRVHITGGSIVLQSISEPGVYSSGTPLQLTPRWQRNYHRFKQLDELTRRVYTLEQLLESKK